jgi:hypothetical protein
MTDSCQSAHETVGEPPDNFVDFLAVDPAISRELADQTLQRWIGEYQAGRKQAQPQPPRNLSHLGKRLIRHGSHG